MIAARTIERLGDRRIVRHRRQAGTWRLRQGFEIEPGRASVFQYPQRQRQFCGRRLENLREEDVERAEPHTVLAQLGTRGLIEGLDLLGHGIALQ